MSLKDLKLLALDVDGVLTDGGIAVNADGSQCVTFFVRDGAGIKHLQHAGIAVAFISGRNIPAVAARARELGVEDVVQGSLAKTIPFEQLLMKYRLHDEQAGFIGDDLADVPLLKRAGWSAAPADASVEAKSAAKHVLSAPGGRGAVREAAELILRAKGKWDFVVETFGLGRP
jgi:3-deoxy-D-manno-octulosonate 8-phosphate phosphatase (KDO 8-P phosphatase)